MEFKGPDHIFRCVPAVFGLRDRFDAETAARAAALAAGKKEKELPLVAKVPVFGLKVITKPDVDASNLEATVFRADHGADKFAEFSAKQKYDLVKSKVAYIENLVVAGQELRDFDAFYKLAPPELVLWVENAVFSTEVLTAAERKNS